MYASSTPLWSEAVEETFAENSKLPVLSPVAIRVIKLSDDPLCDARTLGETIAADPCLTARVLRLANSAYYGFAGRVTDLQQSIVLLGNVTIRNVVLGLSLNDLCSVIPATPYLGEFWTHSFVTANLTFMLARFVRHPSLAHSFTAGLLHDVGKLPIHRAFPAKADSLALTSKTTGQSIAELENNEFNFNHQEVGAWLADKWKLPKVLIESIGYHHAHQLDGDNADFCRLLNVADKLALLPDDRLPLVQFIPYISQPLTQEILARVWESWLDDRERQMNTIDFLKAA